MKCNLTKPTVGFSQGAWEVGTVEDQPTERLYFWEHAINLNYPGTAKNGKQQNITISCVPQCCVSLFYQSFFFGLTLNSFVVRNSKQYRTSLVVNKQYCQD